MKNVHRLIISCSPLFLSLIVYWETIYFSYPFVFTYLLICLFDYLIKIFSFLFVLCSPQAPPHLVQSPHPRPDEGSASRRVPSEPHRRLDVARGERDDEGPRDVLRGVTRLVIPPHTLCGRTGGHT